MVDSVLMYWFTPRMIVVDCGNVLVHCMGMIVVDCVNVLADSQEDCGHNVTVGPRMIFVDSWKMIVVDSYGNRYWWTPSNVFSMMLVDCGNILVDS